MVHLIKNANGQFEVVTIGDNGEFLNGTRQGFERRAGAYTNMFATGEEWGNNGKDITFQDDTLKTPKVFLLRKLASGKLEANKLDMKPEKKYSPKN